MSTLVLQRECIFVGDIHGNLNSLKKVIAKYGDTHFLIFLGDIFNDKTELATVPEIAEIIHILRSLNHAIILHSNHDQMVVKALESPTSKFYRPQGWDVTQAYINSLSVEKKESLKYWLSSHPLWVELITVNQLQIAAAHAYPNLKAEKFRRGKYLTKEQLSCIGIGSPKYWWSSPKYNDVLLNFDQTVVGHHGIIKLHNRLVMIDLCGFSIPTWDPQLSRVEVF